MKKLDTYKDLCTQVYDLSKPKAPENSYAFYRDYARATKGPILEPMCGTGRFLLPLVAEGFDVRGFDGSESMLKSLDEKAKKLGLKPRVWHGFLEDLDNSERYGLIFIPCGSFGLITDKAKVMDALKTFGDCLNDDGVLVFESLFDGETLKEGSTESGVWKGSAWTREDGKLVMMSKLELGLKDEIERTICRYELIDGNAVIKTEIEELKVRYHKIEDLKKMLKEAGFRDLRVFKAFDKNIEAKDDDERIVYECRK